MKFIDNKELIKLLPTNFIIIIIEMKLIFFILLVATVVNTRGWGNHRSWGRHRSSNANTSNRPAKKSQSSWSSRLGGNSNSYVIPTRSNNRYTAPKPSRNTNPFGNTSSRPVAFNNYFNKPKAQTQSAPQPQDDGKIITRGFPITRCVIGNDVIVWSDDLVETSETMQAGTKVKLWASMKDVDLVLYKLGYGRWISSENISTKCPTAPAPSQSQQKEVVLFEQCDKRWAYKRMGRLTLCKAGCLVAAVAIALNDHGKRLNGGQINPGTLNDWLRRNRGFQGDLFVWGTVSRKWGWTYKHQPTNINTIKKWAQNPRAVVILNVRRGRHWVYVTGIHGQSFDVADAGFNKESYPFREVLRAAIYTW